jgi:hypothetical protein
MSTRMNTNETRPQYLQRVRRWIKRQYDKRRETERCHCSHTASAVMMEAQKRFSDLGTFGVEGFCFEPDDMRTGGLSYLNTGDTYELTICFNSDSRRFFLSSWGDIAERYPNAG